MALPIPRGVPRSPNVNQSKPAQNSEETAERPLPRLPVPNRIQQPNAQPRNSAPIKKETVHSKIAKIDFENIPLSKIRLEEYGIRPTELPILQERKSKITSKNYRRELRLVKDDGNARGPIVVDPDTGRLFRAMPESEYTDDTPILQVDDFDADDLNKEAENLLGHLQVTSSREEKVIAMMKRKRQKPSN